MAAPSKGGTSNNKPGEAPFQMKLEPEGKLVFKYKLGTPATMDMKITNTTNDRQTYKVKCTDNDIFRVKPPLGFVEKEETTIVTLTFNAKKQPENNRHFFAIYHVKCTEATKTPKQAWTGATRPEGVARVLVGFEEEKEGQKKEGEKTQQGGGEKKEGEKTDGEKTLQGGEKKEEKKEAK